VQLPEILQTNALKTNKSASGCLKAAAKPRFAAFALDLYQLTSRSGVALIW
jgi:hypothetical protein